MTTPGRPEPVLIRGADPSAGARITCSHRGADLKIHAVRVAESTHVCHLCLQEVAAAPEGLHRRAEQPVVRAFWAGRLVAVSSNTVHLAGVAYFPPAHVRMHHLEASGRVRVSLFGGEAQLLDLVGQDRRCPDGAWHWPPPSPLSGHLPGWIGFGPHVQLEPRPARSA